MLDLYIYIDKNNVEDCLKYGIKLSEYENKVLKLKNVTKHGILAYLSPKDSRLYIDSNYECVRVQSENINAIVYNTICENNDKLIDEFSCEIKDYSIGDYEMPEAIICSSILPESMKLYNKILDKPLVVQNSREFYYEKCINDMIDSDIFSKYELYQTLLILGDQKEVFDVEKDENVKIYTDKISGKKYTKKTS